MSENVYEALARTALLIERDIFGPGTDHRSVIDGLRATTARIITDRFNVSSPAGQTALVTLYAQLAMMGLQIDLDVPTIGLLAEQPPVRDGDLPSGLLDYSDDLLPGGSSWPGAEPDVTFVLGDAPAPPGAVRVSGTAWRATVGRFSSATPWQGAGPVGAMAAASAAAVEGLRAALPHIAEVLGRPVPQDPRWQPSPASHVDVDLSRYQVDGPVQLGDVDVISGGAITNAALYTLLRVPGLSAALRVVEPESLDLSNLNRYALARRSMVAVLKNRILEGFTTAAIRITGVDETFDETTAPQLAPIASRLLVGVDHIPSRWIAQRAAAAGWICVGASSHDFVLVSAHPPGSACAGCVHTRDDPTVGHIPTISFVSFWAGLLQALELITEGAGRPTPWSTTTHVWPFSLQNPRGIHPFRQDAVPNCPVECPPFERVSARSLISAWAPATSRPCPSRTRSPATVGAAAS